MNKEIKTESSMEERFEENFEYMSGGYYASRIGRHAVHPRDIKSFIQSEIDRAVAKREKEIVEMIEKAIVYDHSKCPLKETGTCVGYQNCVNDIENGVINLITKQ